MTIQHITISGELGSGKSTVAQLVADRLGLQVASTGDFQRRIAAQNGATTLETNLKAENDRSIDDTIDGWTLELSTTSPVPIVFDSRMAWWVIPDSYKVRLIVDPLVAAQRIMARQSESEEEYSDINDVVSKMEARFESENKRYAALYNADPTDLAQYDLVIETSDAPIEAVVGLVLDSFLNQAHGVFASPSRILHEPDMSDPSAVPPTVRYDRPRFRALTGMESINEAITAKQDLMQVDVLKMLPQPMGNYTI